MKKEDRGKGRLPLSPLRVWPVICICNHSHPTGQKLVTGPYHTRELNIVFLCKLFSKYSFSYGLPWAKLNSFKIKFISVILLYFRKFWLMGRAWAICPWRLGEVGSRESFPLCSLSLSSPLTIRAPKRPAIWVIWIEFQEPEDLAKSSEVVEFILRKILRVDSRFLNSYREACHPWGLNVSEAVLKQVCVKRDRRSKQIKASPAESEILPRAAWLLTATEGTAWSKWGTKVFAHRWGVTGFVSGTGIAAYWMSWLLVLFSSRLESYIR